MAQSTGVVLTAGAFALGDLVLNEGWTPEVGLRIIVGTIGAAFISAGLDKAAPGFGTGIAVLLLVGAILGNGPRVAAKLFPNQQETGIAAGLGVAGK